MKVRIHLTAELEIDPANWNMNPFDAPTAIAMDWEEDSEVVVNACWGSDAISLIRVEVIDDPVGDIALQAAHLSKTLGMT